MTTTYSTDHGCLPVSGAGIIVISSAKWGNSAVATDDDIRTADHVSDHSLSSSYTLRLQLFVAHPRCHMRSFRIFSQVPLPIAPQSLRPKTHRSPNHPRPTSVKKPAAPHSTRCSRPLAGRASVWTVSVWKGSCSIWAHSGYPS